MKKRRYRTVVPLCNLEIEFQAPYQFAPTITIEKLPDDLRNEKHLLELAKFHREWLEGCTNSLIIHYEAHALGSPDPNWKGAQPRGIEHANRETAYLANIAFWLQRPSPLHFWWMFHMPEFDGRFIVQRSEGKDHFLCHPNDKNERVGPQDLDSVKGLFAALTKIPRETALWTALRSLIAALETNPEEIRYLLLWTALEALFGASTEIRFRISQRIAFFIGRDETERRSIFAETKKAYDFRSKVAHGAWKKNKDSTALTAISESLLRKGMVRLLLDDSLMNRFLGKNEDRESFLDELIFT